MIEYFSLFQTRVSWNDKINIKVDSHWHYGIIIEGKLLF